MVFIGLDFFLHDLIYANSTVTCKLLLHRTHSKLGQYCTFDVVIFRNINFKWHHLMTCFGKRNSVYKKIFVPDFNKLPYSLRSQGENFRSLFLRVLLYKENKMNAKKLLPYY